MMDAIFGALGGGVAATLLVGVWHALRAPTRAEAMLAVQIAGTAAAGSLLLAGPSTIGVAATLDLVIVVAALAAVTAVSFVAFGWEQSERPGGPGRGAPDDRR
jgi:multicomponent Na+:H+ antiporter subunit F